MRRAAIAAAVLALSGCVQSPSSVEGVFQSDDAAAAAMAAADLVQSRVPVTSGPLAIAPPVASQAGNAFTPGLVNLLRVRHYAVLPAGAFGAAAHQVAYVIGPLDGGVLVLVRVDGQPSAMHLAYDRSGWLAPDAPTIAEETAP
jgi:hypothetical protein